MNNFDTFDRTFSIPQRAKRLSAVAVVATVVLATILFVAKAALVAWVVMLILGAFGVSFAYLPLFGITVGALFVLGWIR